MTIILQNETVPPPSLPTDETQTHATAPKFWRPTP